MSGEREPRRLIFKYFILFRCVPYSDIQFQDKKVSRVMRLMLIRLLTKREVKMAGN